MSVQQHPLRELRPSLAAPADWLSARHWGLSGAAWVRIAVIAALLVGVFWPNFRRLFLKVNPFTGESNWQHSFFVPLIGLYYLYLNREALLSGYVPALSIRQKSLGVWAQAVALMLGVMFFAYAYYPSAFVDPLVTNLIIGGATGVAMALLAVCLWATAPDHRRRGGLVAARASADVLDGKAAIPRGAAGHVAARIDRLASSSHLWFGLSCLLGGLLLYAWGIWPGQNDFFKDCAMVATLFGIVLMLCGWGVMRIAWFPILFLACAIPWPGLMYSKIAMPLQQLAASAAVATLNVTGVEAVRVGTKLIIGNPADPNHRILNVAEACAGLKSLMTFVSVGAAVAFLSMRPLWQKLIIAASAVPIAIFCNMMRVAGQGILDHYWSRDLSESFAHQFVGMIMLIPAFFLILLVGWILDNLFVEEADRPAAAAGAAAGQHPGNLVIEAPRRSTAAATGVSELAQATQRLSAVRTVRPLRRARSSTDGAASAPSASQSRAEQQEGV